MNLLVLNAQQSCKNLRLSYPHQVDYGQVQVYDMDQANLVLA